MSSLKFLFKFKPGEWLDALPVLPFRWTFPLVKPGVEAEGEDRAEDALDDGEICDLGLLRKLWVELRWLLAEKAAKDAISCCCLLFSCKLPLLLLQCLLLESLGLVKQWSELSLVGLFVVVEFEGELADVSKLELKPPLTANAAAAAAAAEFGDAANAANRLSKNGKSINGWRWFIAETGELDVVPVAVDEKPAAANASADAPADLAARTMFNWSRSVCCN